MPETVDADAITAEDAAVTDAELDHQELMHAVWNAEREAMRARWAVENVTSWFKMVWQCVVAACVGWCLGTLIVWLFDL